MKKLPKALSETISATTRILQQYYNLDLDGNIFVATENEKRTRAFQADDTEVQF